MKYAAFITLAMAATLASCTLDELQTVNEDLQTIDELDSSGSNVIAMDELDSYVAAVAAEGSDSRVFATPECGPEDDCENHPEVTLSQCLNAWELGSEAVAALCRIILHPVVKEACWRAVNAGPVACANFCYWYFTP